MAITLTTISMDSELKEQLDTLCSELGMTINTAVNMFARAMVRGKKIPFKVEEKEKTTAELGYEAFLRIREQAQKRPELTLAEINEEIAAYRAGR